MNLTEAIFGSMIAVFQSVWWLLPLALLLAFSRSPLFKGWLGEKTVQSGLGRRLDEQVYRPFHNLIIPAEGGTTQIDHLYLSPYGIFVVETKNYSGWIFGSANQARWTQVVYKKKHGFQNPLRQNYAHIKALLALLNLPENKFHSLVIFAGEAEFKTAMPANVCHLGQAVAYVKRFQTGILDGEEIERAAAVLSADEFAATRAKTRDHVRRLRQRK
ncbi:MAG: nuclease-related domain-containing protein [Neisseria sp.]|uniref:nuclease-related domain-containing protein n=1 Tax=Neisseria sp. TaxID=192066 RepID=UPI0026DD4054|nr:nuclease-related domain-containing protein [Neisseria sp.]MDO4640716.1 nuclease-related domain-containing protein [Neisseria sp.]